MTLSSFDVPERVRLSKILGRLIFNGTPKTAAVHDGLSRGISEYLLDRNRRDRHGAILDYLTAVRHLARAGKSISGNYLRDEASTRFLDGLKNEILVTHPSRLRDASEAKVAFDISDIVNEEAGRFGFRLWEAGIVLEGRYDWMLYDFMESLCDLARLSRAACPKGKSPYVSLMTSMSPVFLAEPFHFRDAPKFIFDYWSDSDLLGLESICEVSLDLCWISAAVALAANQIIRSYANRLPASITALQLVELAAGLIQSFPDDGEHVQPLRKLNAVLRAEDRFFTTNFMTRERTRAIALQDVVRE